jgi:hypothetical protein
MIVLAASGDLGDAERALLEGHMEGCPGCRGELEALERFHEALARTAAGEPEAAGVLAQARNELRERLREERSRTSVIDRRAGFFRVPGIARAGAVAGAVALLAAGVLLGRLFGPAGPAPASSDALRQGDAGDTRIANIRFITTDPATGEIEFAFEAVRPVRMKGNINDEKIQRVLSHAIMNDQNAGVRLASISAVSSQRALRDPEIKEALIAALRSDENAGVRAEALKAIRSYPLEPEIKEALLYVLTHDNNPALRITAINILDSVRVAGQALDPAMIDALRRTMENDNNNYIRLRAQTVMEEHRQ